MRYTLITIIVSQITDFYLHFFVIAGAKQLKSFYLRQYRKEILILKNL